MQPRVTAILVVRNGADYLPRTLEGLLRQHRRPDELTVVDLSSTDDSPRLVDAAGPTRFVSVPARTSYVAAVAKAVAEHPPIADGADEWLWLLRHDSDPAPDALQALLSAVEVAPSVVVAGPKIMDWHERTLIARFGETLTPNGAAMPIVAEELDQAQHDVQSDVLGVGLEGMLVRRSVWEELGGFDPALPGADAGLDFCMRARLAGHRVIVAPGARVARDVRIEDFGQRRPSEAKRHRQRRAAQLHRRLVAARRPMVPLHWLAIVPLAFLRALFQLIDKRPGVIGAEFSAAFGVAFSPRAVARARRQLARTRRVGWSAIEPLRMTWSEVRERRASVRYARAEAETPPAKPGEEGAIGLIAGGGHWMLLTALLLSALTLFPLIGAEALVGGGLLPLDGSPGALWDAWFSGWRDIGTGFEGPADPFVLFLSVLGSITFWSPSFAIVVLWFAALPLAALAAFFLVRRLTRRRWLPALAGVLWALAPSLIVNLGAGELGAVVAHLLLPWLVLAALSAARSWSAVATAALLFAATVAAVPSLAPALLVAWLVLLIVRPRRIHRMLWIPLPAVALFAPLAIVHITRGTPLALLADPGVPLAFVPASPWQLALGASTRDLRSWSDVVALVGLPEQVAPVVLAVLVAPLAVLALLALGLRSLHRAAPALLMALLGLVSAIAAAQISVSAVDGSPVPLWVGGPLGLYWLGALVAAFLALEALPRTMSRWSGGVLVAFGVVAAMPALVTSALGQVAVAPLTQSVLPAYVAAAASTDDRVGTLLLTPRDDGSVATELQRGAGDTLDDQSTLDATATGLNDEEQALAALVVDLASVGSDDPSAALAEYGISFVVLRDTPGEAPTVAERVAEALDGDAAFTPIGQSAVGLLWQVGDSVQPGTPAESGGAVWRTAAIAQTVLLGLVLLLAIPTGRRARVRRRAHEEPLAEAPDETYDNATEDDHV